MLLNLIYLFVLVLLSPWLVWRAVTTGRYRSGLAAKFLGRVTVSSTPANTPVVWFHAVSVGEVNLLGTLVPAFRKRFPNWSVVVSSTTDTGLAEARKKFTDIPVIAWPLDFTWAVRNAITCVKPSLIVLTESELWPNFLACAHKRNIPVVVANARMSPRSARRLSRVAWLARRMLFRHITHFAVQEADYTTRFRELGVPDAKLTTTGSIKYDGAAKERNTPQATALAHALGLSQSPTRNELVWLAGSTHAPEEAIVLRVFAKLQARFRQLRLILVPRHPDRFAEVARLVADSGLAFVRRSEMREPLPEMPAIVLFDTVGELGAAWALADVGFTGGSLEGKRGGQSMIEPAGYGVPCVFGPHVWNFKDAAKRLIEVGAAIQIHDESELERELTRLIENANLRARMGETAREMVLRQQGATERTLNVLQDIITTTALTHCA
jgi:3-deoxy-D-manno-octulosonic-acid transferase